MTTLLAQPAAAVLRAPAAPLAALPELPPEVFHGIRRRMVLDCCKWDPQVGDVSTLAPFALSISRATWRQLSRWAEAMSDEALAAERELLRRPELHHRLGLPRRIRRLLRQTAGSPLSSAAARTIRFDFHWTTDGWRISEANTDVPGGFTEASSFTAIMAEHYPAHRSAGNPVAMWADAIAATAASAAVDTPAVALLSAPGFVEDQQIMAYLAQRLRERGLDSHLANPAQVRWHAGRAFLRAACFDGPVSAVVRFYQGEWLARLPRRIEWQQYFIGSETPIANPATAMFAESKRFPLVWDRINARPATWDRLLPHTCDPRDVRDVNSAEWIFKTAFCNTGDAVCAADSTSGKAWRKIRRALRRPWQTEWVAQRRFTSVPIDTPRGPMHACVGVYTVDGRAAGIYGRISPKPVIDYEAMDVAILLRPDDEKESA